MRTTGGKSPWIVPAKFLIKSREFALRGNKLLVGALFCDTSGIKGVDVVAEREKVEGVGNKYHSFASLRERGDGAVEECFANVGVNCVVKVSKRILETYVTLTRRERVVHDNYVGIEIECPGDIDLIGGSQTSVAVEEPQPGVTYSLLLSSAEINTFLSDL